MTIEARFKCRILHAPNRIAKLSECKMRRLNQFNTTYFNSMQVSRMFDWSSRIYDWSWIVDLNAVFYVCRIEFKLCEIIYVCSNGNLKRVPHAQQFYSAKNRRLNQISRTHSFGSTKISIWFGASKMIRLNQAWGTGKINTVPFVTWNTRNFKAEYLVEWKAPKTYS